MSHFICVTHLCVEWVIAYKCDGMVSVAEWLICVWNESFHKCDRMTYLCVEWVISYKCDGMSHSTHTSKNSVTPSSPHTYGYTYLNESDANDSFHTRMDGMTRVWHDLFIYVTCLIHICDMAHIHGRRAAICVTCEWLNASFCARMDVITHSYWVIHMWLKF